MEEIRLLIREGDFKALVSGKIVEIRNGTIKIALQDIGYDRMLQIIEQAKEKMEAGE